MRLLNVVLLLSAFVLACQSPEKRIETDSQSIKKGDEIDSVDRISQKQQDTSVFIRYDDFDTVVKVTFLGTSTPDTTQVSVLNYLQKNQKEITRKMMPEILSHYSKSYQYCKRGVTLQGGRIEEMQDVFPWPATQAILKKHIYPYSIDILPAVECKEQSFSIQFDCTWDVEHGLGVVFENGEVKDVATAVDVY